MTVRLGVAGCGAIARLVHLRNARRLHGVEVTALADPSPEALAAAARLAPRATRHADTASLLAAGGVDAVLVGAATGLHARIALEVLSAGRHLYLEKPIAATLEDGEAVEREAARAGVVAAVGFNRRFHPLVLEARRLLAAGSLGRVAAARGVFCEPVAGEEMPAWKRLRETGGGAPLDLASHHVDLLRFLLGGEPEAVGAELRSVRSEHDDATLLFRLGAADAELRCSFVRGRRDDLELDTEAGRTLRISRYEGRLTLDGRAVRAPGLASLRARALAGRTGDVSYRPALAAFAAAVRGEAAPLPTIADGLAGLRAVLAAEALA